MSIFHSSIDGDGKDHAAYQQASDAREAQQDAPL
jgi:hypothetical protein